MHVFIHFDTIIRGGRVKLGLIQALNMLLTEVVNKIMTVCTFTTWTPNK